MKSRARTLLNRMGYHLRALDPLTQLMNEAGSDKGWGLRGRHYYTRIYHRLFDSLRHRPLTFVEIGLLRADRDQRRARGAAEGTSHAVAGSAPSLQAWSSYFPQATLIGFDIDDFSNVTLPRTTILQGDMSNQDDLQRLIDACPNQTIDVLIDDGSHASHHQQIALATLFPRIAPGGLYCIEDCHWQDPAFESDGVIKTRDMLQIFHQTGQLRSTCFSQETASHLASAIDKVTCHDSIEPGQDDTEDALCILRKKA